jgi:hypothetical protein
MKVLFLIRENSNPMCMAVPVFSGISGGSVSKTYGGRGTQLRSEVTNSESFNLEGMLFEDTAK